MRFGAHLPVAGFGGELPRASTVIEVAEAAEALGYTTLCANDHLRFVVPWMDGLMALGVAAARTSSIRLMTTAALLVVRGAAPLGSALAGLQHLSQGRLTAALTPGSTSADYELVGIPFEERWARFDIAIKALERYLGSPAAAGLRPPLWIASWGSEAGLRRVARHGEGWLASAYHATADHLGEAWSYLRSQLRQRGKDANNFPNAVATTYAYLTEDPAEGRAVLSMLVSPRQAPADLRDRSLIGPVDQCLERLRRLKVAGAQEVFVWPVRDEVAQLRRFAEEVVPLLQRDRA
jgi:alkanesulfonate monooxygenase SsuD/methylene tetrahydromethanopterin reductase-like flavin-dependent oxidoreductase (luciferase family)